MTATTAIETVVFALGVTLSVALPLAVIAVAIRGYRGSDGNGTTLKLAVGVVLVTAVPTLLRLGFGSVLPGGSWTPFVVRSTELSGLLVVIWVMHGE